MTLYRKLCRKPKQFLAVTGMNLHQVQELLPQFEHTYREQESQRKASVVKTGEARQRRAGGGSQFAHELSDRLLMLLIYYRLYLTQEFLTLLFKHQDKSSISRNIKQMRDLFELVLPTHAKALEKVLSLAKKEEDRRRKRIGSIEEFKEAYPELTFIIDGVEQEKRKPQNKESPPARAQIHVSPRLRRSSQPSVLGLTSRTWSTRAHLTRTSNSPRLPADVWQVSCRHAEKPEVSTYAVVRETLNSGRLVCLGYTALTEPSRTSV